jgi:hypothetical protein
MTARRRIALVAAACLVSSVLASGDLHALSGSRDPGVRDWLTRTLQKFRCIIVNHVDCTGC